MKVYVTKYALTRGIEVKEVTGSAMDDRYVYTKETYHRQFMLGRDAFHAYEDAAVGARAMRDKKRASLKKQLDKLNTLIFPAKMPGPLCIAVKED